MLLHDNRIFCLVKLKAVVEFHCIVKCTNSILYFKCIFVMAESDKTLIKEDKYSNNNRKTSAPNIVPPSTGALLIDKSAVPNTAVSEPSTLKRKQTSFQITSVTVKGSRLSTDGGEDSADDLDESHTEDASSDILDCSRTTDVDNDQLSEDNTNTNNDETSNPAPSIPVDSKIHLPISKIAQNNALFPSESSQLDNVEEKLDLSLESSQHVKPPTLPDQWQHRFRVVKIVSSVPFKRGRWLCMDFMDPPAPIVEAKPECIDTCITSGMITGETMPVDRVAHVYEIPPGNIYPGTLSMVIRPDERLQPMYGIFLPISNGQYPLVSGMNSKAIGAPVHGEEKTHDSSQSIVSTQTIQHQNNVSNKPNPVSIQETQNQQNMSSAQAAISSQGIQHQQNVVTNQSPISTQVIQQNVSTSHHAISTQGIQNNVSGSQPIVSTQGIQQSVSGTQPTISTQKIQQNISCTEPVVSAQAIQQNVSGPQPVSNQGIQHVSNIQPPASSAQGMQHNVSNLQPATSQGIVHNVGSMQPVVSATQGIPHNIPSIQPVASTQGIQHSVSGMQPPLSAGQGTQHVVSSMQPAASVTQGIQQNISNLQSNVSVSQGVQQNVSNTQSTVSIQSIQQNVTNTQPVASTHGMQQSSSDIQHHVSTPGIQQNVSGTQPTIATQVIQQNVSGTQSTTSPQGVQHSQNLSNIQSMASTQAAEKQNVSSSQFTATQGIQSQQITSDIQTAAVIQGLQQQKVPGVPIASVEHNKSTVCQTTQGLQDINTQKQEKVVQSAPLIQASTPPQSQTSTKVTSVVAMNQQVSTSDSVVNYTVPTSAIQTQQQQVAQESHSTMQQQMQTLDSSHSHDTNVCPSASLAEDSVLHPVTVSSSMQTNNISQTISNQDPILQQQIQQPSITPTLSIGTQATTAVSSPEVSNVKPQDIIPSQVIQNHVETKELGTPPSTTTQISPEASQEISVTKSDINGEESESVPSGTSTVAIDNKIEQAMDLVKSHLMFAVREEVDVLKEKITELMDRISQLEYENGFLRANASQQTLEQLNQSQLLQQQQNQSPAVPVNSVPQISQQPLQPQQFNIQDQQPTS